MIRTRFLPVLAAGLAAFLVACGGDPTGPGSGSSGVVFVAGNNLADTAYASLAQALVVEVHDANGAIAPNVVVRFESAGTATSPAAAYPSRLDATGYGGYGGYGYTAVAVDTTDANGKARAMVQFGRFAGPAVLVVRVPELGYQDTAHFVVKPGNLAGIKFTTADTALLLGGQYNVGAYTVDRSGNKRTGDSVSYRADGVVSTVDAAGLVHPVAPGRGKIVATSGAISDSARVTVIPDFTLNMAFWNGSSTQVGTVRTDGSALTAFTPVTSSVLLPTITSDGTQSVFYEGSPGSTARIYVADRQHARRTVVAPTAELVSMYEARVTADGSWVYFTGTMPYDNTAVRYGSFIWRVHLDGTGLERLTDGTGSVAHSMASPSPDGTKVVFVNAGTLQVLDLATRAVTSLGVQGSLPRFSPDGTRITYVGSGSSYYSTIFIVNADGTAAQRLTTAGLNYQTYAAPDWSPDGKWIVARGSARLELWRVSDGLLLELPFSGNMYQASFKP